MTEDTVHFNKHSLMVGWNEEEWVGEELGVGSRFWVVGMKSLGKKEELYSLRCTNLYV